MPQISLREVSIRYHGPHLLENISAVIEPGDCIGLLGRNGTGKTTLLRLIAGLEKPDHGTIELAAGTRVAFLTQDVPEGLQGSVWEVVQSGVGAGDPDDHAEEEAWVKERQVERTLTQMRLDGDRSFATLSTGMKRRVLLARALAGNPDVLLLDEPTNHLDIDAIQWLEGFLSSLNKTVIFVTHDRAFLTKLANRILEIDRGQLFDWSCDYQTFQKRKEQALASEEKEQALFDKKLALEEVWIRQGIKARRTRNEGRVRALEAMRRQRQQRQKTMGTARLEIDSGMRSGALVAQANDISLGYDQHIILSNFSTTIMRGDKIGIIGANGSGKSTLLRGLLGQQPVLSGSVRLGTNLQIAYFDQTREQLELDKTAEENVGQGKTTIEVAGKSRHVIGYLQEFLFSPEQARSPIRFFSGGQRNRLLLAKLFSRSANLLVLDEPTNDLDTETLELLEAKLVDYDGTVLLVSHDREFLNNVVSSTIVFEAGQAREYFGGYNDWLRQRDAATMANSPSRKEKVLAASGKGADAPTVGATKAVGRKLSFKEQRELGELPKRIESLERQRTELHAEMAEPGFYKQPSQKITAAQARLRELDEEVASAFRRWEELEGS